MQRTAVKLQPLVFTFNVLRKFYREFQLEHFAQIQQVLSRHSLNACLMPIVNTSNSEIYNRSQQIYQKLQKWSEESKCSNFHVISLGVSGLDMLNAIKEFPETSKMLLSLTTVSSPLQGWAFSDLNNPVIWGPAARVIGISDWSIRQLSTQNIKQELQLKNVANKVNIYSTSSQKHYLDANPMFQQSCQNLPEWNDGVVTVDESQLWTEKGKENDRNIFTFELDHSELVGRKSEHVYEVICENLREKTLNKQK